MDPKSADSIWSFEDIMRRCTTKLFEWSEDPKLIARRAVYRAALLNIAMGLADENPLQIGVAGDLIAKEFQGLSSFDEYQDPKRGVEVQPDDDAGPDKIKPWM